MHHVSALPGVRNAVAQRWGSRPEQELEQFLQALDFLPATVEFWFHGNFYPVAELLGLYVPLFRGERRGCATFSGHELAVAWGSTDGRATDYLRLTGALDADALKAFFAQIQAVMALDSRRDLEIVVKSAPLET